jgi:thioester reductase-like protein
MTKPKAAPKILVTGFPGFLGSELVPRILRRGKKQQVVCLVQPKFAELAARRRDSLVAADPAFANRIHLVTGDITQPGLGLDDSAQLAAETTEILHLAAVYDLSVRRDVGMHVNLGGTKQVLRFAADSPRLERLQYISTCYVSGRYAGIYREEDLDKGQTFNNFYEESKFLAEAAVRDAMRGGLPATIYRPAVVVGDSQTGATQKYDGPYFAIRWILKQPAVAMLPVVGDTHRTRINLVPRDFVTTAIDYLSTLPAAKGKTYQLADPEPLTIDELLDAIGQATGKTIVRLPLPLALAKAAIEKVPGINQLLQIPSSSVDYFVHPTYYDTANSKADLTPAGIAVPPLRDYLSILVAFMRAHPEIRSEAMV